MKAVLMLFAIAAGLATIVAFFSLVGFWGGLIFLALVLYGCTR